MNTLERSVSNSVIDSNYSEIFAGYTLPKLLKRIETETNPGKFKEIMLRAIQLYFDGLVEGNFSLKEPDIWAKQEEALNAILLAVRMTVSGFYITNKDVPFSNVRDTLLPHDSILIQYGSKRSGADRRLQGKEFEIESYAKSVAQALQGKKVDLIVPVASGGFEPAAITAGYMGAEDMFPIRHSPFRRKDDAILVPKQAPPGYVTERFRGASVLVIEDLVDSGITASKIVEFVRSFSPHELYFAFVQGKGSPLLNLGWNKHNESKYLFTAN